MVAHENALMTAELWAIAKPLRAATPATFEGGCPRVPDWVCSAGIAFVLEAGIR